MEERVYNFSAGPSMMPVSVLEKAKKDLLCYPGAGASVLEMSHRSNSFEEILKEAKDDLRSIMEIPEEYEILFVQGGATMQFSMVPMNLANQGDTASYIVTGNFAGKAQIEADRFLNAEVIASSKDKNFSYIPKITPDMISKDSKYVHITGNNTIYGTTYNSLPNVGDKTLVADWSSAILGKWIDVKDYGLIYAGAQKNMGPSGMAVVIIRRDLVKEDVDPITPIMLRYKPYVDNNSMYNTPPTFSIYMAGLMFKWVKESGGIRELEKINKYKSNLVYDLVENSSFYNSPVEVEDRSIMNVPFTLPTEELTKEFIDMCKQNGIINIKGHKSVGGCRASMYNGMPVSGVQKLVNLMKDFEVKNK